MRIALLTEYFYPDNSGSTPTDLAELSCYLKQHHPALEIDVITSKNLYRPSGVESRLAPREDWQGMRIRRLATPKSNRPSMVLRLAAGTIFALAGFFELLRRPRYDLLLIVTNPPTNAFAAWMYSKLRGVRYVYLVHDLYPDIAVAMGRLKGGSWLVSLIEGMQRAWLNSAASIVALGRCMRRHLHERYKVPLDRINVITSWADPKAITVLSRENDFRRRNGLSGFVAMYAGNFSRYVNFEQILGAAEELGPQEGITFVLVGDGVRREEILDRVAKDRLANVKVLPRIPRAAMNEVLAAADVCLISLDPKMVGLGVPSKLYAALASGRPTVAMVPEHSEVGEVLVEEECGINVADGDSRALAMALRKLQRDPDLAHRMGQNARSALEQHFTIGHSAEKFWSVFERAIGAGHGIGRRDRHEYSKEGVVRY